MSRVPGMVCSLLVFSALWTPNTRSNADTSAFRPERPAQASPPVFRHQLHQVVYWNLVALLFEERWETRLPVQRPVVIPKNGPIKGQLGQCKENTASALRARLNFWPLTWQTRRTAYGTGPVYCRSACWISLSSGQSVGGRGVSDLIIPLRFSR